MTVLSTIAPQAERPSMHETRHARRLTSLWALYVLAVRQYLHGKRWMVMGLLFLLPAALALVIRRTSPDAPSLDIEFFMAFMFIPQALLPLGALIYASGMIQDELEEQTITYPLMRPIAKWAFYLVKLAATLTTVVILTAIFTSVTYAAVYAGSATPPAEALHRCLIAMCLHGMAAGAYCCLFALISMLTRRSLIAGVFYSALVEGLLANLPMSVRLLTVIYYSRLIAYRALSFVTQNPWGTENPAADVWQFDVINDPLLKQHPSTPACITILLAGSLLCALSGALICWRREFYVKTPEKN
jgi:ABC-2 type transport system permease protein